MLRVQRVAFTRQQPCLPVPAAIYCPDDRRVSGRSNRLSKLWINNAAVLTRTI